MKAVRHLMVVLGDQLDAQSAVFDDFDPAQDAVWMCECCEEAEHVWSHKARIALFMAAMRHFAQAQNQLGRRVLYRGLGMHAHRSLSLALAADLQSFKPHAVYMVQAGDWRVRESLRAQIAQLGIEFREVEDRHFLCSGEEFRSWMSKRTQPRMEHFYRWMRQRRGWLMQGSEPVGGSWNYDEDNRTAFGKTGPGPIPAPRAFEADAMTRAVLQEVQAEYADHPGSLQHFDWPVTREQALQALEDFVVHRLDAFGPFQDAMWSDVSWPSTLLYHSRLSAALNLKLLDPREVCEAAIARFHAGQARLSSVEGFVRQILGWREYVRGLYWHRMPQYLDDNALDAQQRLPAFYWTGDTQMNCLHQCLKETLAHGYAHHIQRLMVTGLFALLLGVRPREVHEWYLAVYVDAVEWVELPNTLGMSQHADGGFMASKPYVASGKYIHRMSNYCASCRYRPELATGDQACPVTTLYWDFLDRHRTRFAAHPRLKMQINNLTRKSEQERADIRAQAQKHRLKWSA
ncbi:MAG: cryptochrome/photolyase family protein [Panacagrimonas sp.]